MKKSCFITLEGIEGAGKSTQVNFIKKYLKIAGCEVVTTREPGGTEVAEAIRKILLTHHKETITQETELLLMFAGRSQHIANVIQPALKDHKWVICDRFTDASYAYQGGGRGIPLERIATLEKWVQAGLHPDLVLFLDLPIKIALKRVKKRRGKLDRIEAEQAEFFQRVRDGYLARAKQFPERYQIINASAGILKVQKQIQTAVDHLLKKHK